ncbi:MAG TPA: hypothetical protein VI454_11630 [Verrucomicrobiae bacterium]
MAIIALLSASPAFPQSYFLPVVDGNIFACEYVVSDNVLAVSQATAAVLEFANFKSKPFNSIRLSLNPYALPLFTHSISVFGYDGADGIITANDCLPGKYLGTWTLAPDLDFGDDAFFDVTDFVHSLKSDFFGFRLTTDGGSAVFSSSEINYGTPPHLVATHWPERARRSGMPRAR